ncbi:hypothetical protein Q5752_005942 [Cryptotrichosporon argae]
MSSDPNPSASSTTEHQQPGSRPRAPKVSAPHSHLGTLWSRSLPAYGGPYRVGVLDVEVPIEPGPQRIGSFVHRKSKLPRFGRNKDKAADQAEGRGVDEDGSAAGETGETGPADGDRGIEIDTALFTLFYPCDTEPSVGATAAGRDRERGAVWFPRFGSTVAGFMRMAGKDSKAWSALAALPTALAAYGLKFPAYQRAPLLAPPPNETGGRERWPLVIWSHGVGCSRLFYTEICGQLASHGFVVAAVEHRDGTGPSATVTAANGETKDVDFIRWKDIDWPDLPPDEQPTTDNTLRHDQLAVRLAEFDATLAAVRSLVSGDFGDGAACRLLASRTVDWSKWRDAVQVADGKVVYAGHSFGGTAAIAAADDPRFSPAAVIALDPAIERLEPWTGTIDCPLLCVNSEEFTDSDDYDRLLRVAKTATKDTHICSLAGTTHPSFSDVFLITPAFVAARTGLTMPAYDVFQRTLQAIYVFLQIQGTAAAASPAGIEDAGVPTLSADGSHVDAAAADSKDATVYDEICAMGRAVTGRPTRPIGQPGEFIYQARV